VPGSQLTCPYAQQQLISRNYTHVARDALELGMNVFAQLVRVATIDGEQRVSLSCNPDLTVDLVPKMRTRATTDRPKSFKERFARRLVVAALKLDGVL